MKKMNKKGFTLIEMLVVIAIIAVLVSIVIPTVSNSTKKAQEAADVANIRSAVAQYQINYLNDSSVTWAAPTLKFADKYNYNATTGVITYTCETLTDGNDPTDNHTYTWTIGDLLNDTTGSSTPSTTTCQVVTDGVKCGKTLVDGKCPTHG